MKPTTFENLRTRERFVCDNIKTDIKLIEDVEFLLVHKVGTSRKILIRKDTLSKVKPEKI